MLGTSVLVVEDDDLLRDIYGKALCEAGYSVRTAADAFAAQALLDEAPADLLLLDVGLPGLDGLSFARQLRRTGDMGLVIASQRDSADDRIAALELGCDDYMVKPLHLGELAARVQAVLRRRSPRRRLALGPLTLDLDANAAIAGGRELDFTRGEFCVLTLLAAADGKIVTRETLCRRVSRNPGDGDLRTVDALVSRIRKKLDGVPGAERLIATAPGFGYRLGVPVAAA